MSLEKKTLLLVGTQARIAQRKSLLLAELGPHAWEGGRWQARAKLQLLLNPSGSTDPVALARIGRQINALASPAYRHLLADRPAQTLPKVHCPVLALGGKGYASARHG